MIFSSYACNTDIIKNIFKEFSEYNKKYADLDVISKEMHFELIQGVFFYNFLSFFLIQQM